MVFYLMFLVKRLKLDRPKIREKHPEQMTPARKAKEFNDCLNTPKT